MHKLGRVLHVAILAALLFTLIPIHASTYAAEPKRVFFKETGYWVADFFLDYYNTRGGLDMYGYPRSNQFIEDGRVVQYFQRARMEWWPQNPAPYQVQLTLLADLYYGPGAPPIPASQIPAANNPDFRYYKETGHTLAYAFKTYFDNNGGLDMFGYPTTEQYIENGFIVQRFQRHRLEYHPENPAPYIVQLGLLGDQILERQARLQDPSKNPVGLFGAPATGSTTTSVASTTQAATPVQTSATTPTPPPATVTPTPPPAPKYAYGQDGSPRPFENCGLTQVFGYIRDENGNGIAGQVVKVGVRNGSWSAASFPSGADGKYDLVLDVYPKAGAWYVFVVGPNEAQLSEIVNFDTVSSCTQGSANTVQVNFKKGAVATAAPPPPAAPAPAAVSQPQPPAPTQAPPPTPAPQSGKLWRIVEARYLTPCENHGMHNLFVEAYDANGAPLNGVRVVFQSQAGPRVLVTGDKGAGKTETPLYKEGGTAYVEGGDSDVSPFFTTDIPKDVPCTPGQNDGNTWFHYSYKIIFKKSR